MNRSTTQNERSSHPGFSLMELLVAMAVFMIIGAAAFSLVRRHIPLYANQQNQAGLNITLRNAAAQLQVDAVNAGTGYYPGSNIAAWPVGVTVVNTAPGVVCYDATTKTYGAGCFDTLNVIATDSSAAPAHPSNSAGGDIDLATTTNIYLTPVGTTATALAALYKTGDQILLIKNDGNHMTSVKLAADATVSGAYVKLTCVNAGSGCTDSAGVNSADPLNIATSNDNTFLLSQFGATDWVVKLAPITYTVDASNSADPKLIRRQNGIDNVIAEQVIGFKVGVSTWNSATSNSTDYSYDPTSYGSNWGNVRAIRVSLIGRTPPNPDGHFQNSFDQGNYKVEAISVVVNPRNLSMND